jgi:S-DNA-T family DNA segregation ATPase FtsK/SpoIIIE
LLRDLVESDEFICSDSKTICCLGKDVTGNPVFADIAKMPHVLVAGATGMGKSVCINAILLSILYKARPDEVKFIMIDPKKVEFNGYNGIPHLLVPVVTDVKQAAGTLMWAVEQMEKRYDLMEKFEVKKIDSYNDKVRENPELGEPLPKIIIVIDELNDIMLQVRKPAEDLIMSIAQKARAAGIHLIIGTQRPSVDVITGVIKANIPSRISCKVASYNDSKTILEQAGADKLLNNGDMLYKYAGDTKLRRVQGAYVSDEEVSAIMKFLKSQAKGNVYDEQALEEINRAAQKCAKGKGDDFDDEDDDENAGIGYLNDQQFLDAVDLAIKSGKISTSLIQRKISIGYGKAAKFIDIMEELGIVSGHNGQKPRDVLLTKDEWHEMLARRSMD